MPDTIVDFLNNARPTAERPLLGHTVLLVEDSRFASEAMRLLCLRSGARIRRADSLRSARRHLQVYRPCAVIVDPGLPDGSGLDLLRDLTRAAPRIPVLLATSGDPLTEAAAIAAGADGFLAKPVASLALFQEAILSRLPPDRRPSGPRQVPMDMIEPDPIAYEDDLAHAVEVLGEATDPKKMDYAVQFLSGVALSARDEALAEAVRNLGRSRATGAPFAEDAARMAGLLQARLMTRKAI